MGYTEITAETTDEQLMAPVRFHQQRLIDLATEAIGIDFQKGTDLVAYAQNVASSEAVVSVAWRYRDLVMDDATKAERLDFLMRTMLSSPRDTWSGRTNDSARSSADAVRSFVDQMVNQIRREKD